MHVHPAIASRDSAIVSGVFQYFPILLILLGLVLRAHEPSIASVSLFMGLLVLSIHEFSPVGNRTLSRINVAGTGYRSPVISITSIAMFVLIVLALANIIFPYNKNDQLVLDVFSMSIIIVPTTVLFGWIVK